MQRGALGASALKADLQRALNPNAADMIMQTENDDRKVFSADPRARRPDQPGGRRARPKTVENRA